jgi:outer membrane protein OmpA-like peptidoglycan-associated protein
VRTAAVIAIAIRAALAVLAFNVAGAETPAVPLEQGLVIVSATHADDGDRENVVTVEEYSAAGARYTWHLTEPAPNGGTKTLNFARLVRADDLASARALNTVFSSLAQGARPGTTSFSFSTQIYDSLLKDGSVPFTMTNYDPVLGSSVAMPGTMTLFTTDAVPFPVLLNGRRVSLPSLQFRGVFTYQGERISHDYWVLADRSHPLILRNTRGSIVLQTVRIETPQRSTSSAVEQELKGQCRVELPGIYFAFGTAELDAASTRTLSELAQVLSRNPQWTVSIEGHTDNVGSDEANDALSRARAAAVRTSLVSQHHVDEKRLQSAGFGETRPRETNDTLEGRARNRRVEVVRDCATKS